MSHTAYILVGLPGSGKSTWARKKCAELREAGEMCVIVNRDALRQMMHGEYAYNPDYEPMVSSVARSAVRHALVCGSVIVDETHITEEKRWRRRIELEVAGGVDDDLAIKFVWFREWDNALANRMKDARGLAAQEWDRVIEGMKKSFELLSESETRKISVIEVPPLDPPPAEQNMQSAESADMSTCSKCGWREDRTKGRSDDDGRYVCSDCVEESRIAAEAATLRDSSENGDLDPDPLDKGSDT